MNYEKMLNDFICKDFRNEKEFKNAKKKLLRKMANEIEKCDTKINELEQKKQMIDSVKSSLMNYGIYVNY